VPGISQPYSEEWVASYLANAKEPDDNNIIDEYDNSYVAACQWYATSGGKLATLINNYDWCIYEGSPVTQADKDWYTANVKDMLAAVSYWDWNSNSETAYAILMKLKEYTGDYNYWNLTVNSPGGLVPDETYVTNFKITGTWNGEIPVAEAEGSSSPGAERTIVVTGTWNFTGSQKIGSLGKLIIANGGKVDIAAGKTLSMVNQAQLVVLPGGRLTGAGTIEVNNGNEAGRENYNGGTIDVAVFNNNFGKFYNYGQFLVTEYQGGAQESNFYNHSLVSIKHTGLGSETPNARIFNACQWYCEGSMRMRNYEGIAGSAFIVGEELMVSGSEDGTTTPSYVALADGALVKVGSLYNNGTSWTGPQSGAAVVSIGKVTFLNWSGTDGATLDTGYFENNIDVEIKDDTNIPGGNGYSSGETAYASWKFWNIVANGLNSGTAYRGTGNVNKVKESTDAGSTAIIAADTGFRLGVSGCTPGFQGTEFTPPGDDEQEVSFAYRYCFEDNFPTPGDYDFNDCVVTLTPHVVSGSSTVTVDVSLDATGANKKLAVGLRIKGLKYSMINPSACSSTVDFDANVPGGVLGSKIVATKYNNMHIVSESDLYNKGGERIDDVTLRLCDDLHWTIGQEKQGDYPLRIFYNTMMQTYEGEAMKPARTETLTFTLTDAEYAQIFEDYSNFDVFIVESSGIDFEVHTYDDKFTQVMKWGEPGKLDSYKGATRHYTWAICVPHSAIEPFLYPVEWQSISGNTLQEWSQENNTQTQAAAYPDFYKWVQNKGSNLTWYKNRVDERVYNPSTRQ
jgi:LruC domain-containing protein